MDVSPTIAGSVWKAASFGCPWAVHVVLSAHARTAERTRWVSG